MILARRGYTGVLIKALWMSFAIVSSAQCQSSTRRYGFANYNDLMNASLFPCVTYAQRYHQPIPLGRIQSACLMLVIEKVGRTSNGLSCDDFAVVRRRESTDHSPQ
jgi:hypothetical protein